MRLLSWIKNLDFNFSISVGTRKRKNLEYALENSRKENKKLKAIVLVDFENLTIALEKRGDLTFKGVSNFVRKITRKDGYEISFYFLFSPDSMGREAKSLITHLYNSIDFIDIPVVPATFPCPSLWVNRKNSLKTVDTVDWKMTFVGMRLIRELAHIDRIYLITGDYDFSLLRSDAETHGIECKILKLAKDQFALDYFLAYGGEEDVIDYSQFVPEKTEKIEKIKERKEVAN